jgi:hypothetical protein
MSAIEQGVVSKLQQSVSDFGSSIEGTNTGNWSSSYLWDPAVFAVREKGGAMYGWLDNIKKYTPTVWEQIPAELRDEFDGRMTDIKAVLDEIHRDGGGDFRDDLISFQDYGGKIAGALNKVKWTEAEVPAETGALDGWKVVNNEQTETEKVTIKAAEQVQEKAHGAS